MRKLSLVILSIASLAILAPTPARAGFNFGGGAGHSDVEADHFHDGDLGWKVFGGWRFNRHFGVEGQHANLGEAKDGSVKVEVTHTTAYAVGAIGGDRFEVFGKLGFGRWDANVTGAPDDDDIDLAWGFGVEFLLTDHVGVRGEYERFEVDPTDKVSLLSASIDFRF